MSVTSLIFGLFCLCAILVYRLAPVRFRNPWLLIVSLIFVITWSWQLAAILLGVAGVNYFLGGWLGQADKRRRYLLWIGIIFNILVLIVMKYEYFYLPELTRWLEQMGIGLGPGALQVIVSVGLSFIALQMISYLVDVSRGQLVPERRWLEFNLYVFYFPKFLSGPIERLKSFIPRLDEPRRLDRDRLIQALGLIFIGLIRKRLFADMLNAMIPADAFTHPLNYTATILLSWLLAYAFALYNDFAGYSSIVRGLSSLFGIELSNNFNLPYMARSFSEFWNRWHISLSNWLRDYIFFPLSRLIQRKKPLHVEALNLVIPPLVTMMVSGLWHGLSWSLLVWGGLHGTYLVLERLSKLRGPNIPVDELPKYRQVIGNVIVFLGVVLAWLPFRMDLVTAKGYLAGLILPARWAAPDWLFMRVVLSGHQKLGDVYAWNIPDPRIILVLIAAILLDIAQMKKGEAMLLRWPRWAQVTLFVVAALGFFLLAFSDTHAPFVYQGF